MNTSSQNLAIAKRFFVDLEPGNDIEEIVNHCVYNTHVRYNSYGSSIGNSSLIDECIFSRDGLGLKKVKIINSDCTDNHVWLKLEVFGNQKKVFKGIEAKNKPFSIISQVTGVFDNGKIIEFTVLIDNASLVNQLANTPEEAARAIKTKILSKKPLDTIETLCVAFTEGCGHKIGAQKLRCLALWIARKNQKDIASIVGLSYATVNTYIEWVKIKLSVDTRAQLFEYIIEHRLLHILELANRIVLSE